MSKRRVGILGATGMVGQNYVTLLANHPQFEIAFLAASPDSAGKTYRQALLSKGRSTQSLSESIASMPVHSIDAIDKARETCELVFSAVGTEAAKEYEERYANAGIGVMTNASYHRLAPDVPLIIPEVNEDHLEVIHTQRSNRGWTSGFIIAKPNCSIQSYLIPLYPLHKAFGIEKLVVTTMQAVSGAGYPGVSSLDIIDNIVPYIDGEEEKSEVEPLKILGDIGPNGIHPIQGISIAAHCNRVPVLDGHMACVSVKFAKRPDMTEVLRLWSSFSGTPQKLELHSAPKHPILYRDENDRPQPRLDRNAGNGMTVTVGRLRPCPVFDYRFVALSHNTLRGAATGCLLNAELALALGYIGERS